MINGLGIEKIYLWTQPIDFRKGIDGLQSLVVSQFGLKPFSGAIFIFRSRRADRLKMVFWDGSGVVLVLKRLEDRPFTWPTPTGDALIISNSQFSALFEGIDWRQVFPRLTHTPTSL
ncbi:IS66 family insertion sequence element accessory protein TnpB [Pseudomonas sp. GX19020]|uniref:IS66 family insertion sequence element accessory protein TnpB n=1 Tax=Pseudomonas sp. GX19020 TaxID=2942277 RepID=UPI002019FE70|nr:IS66 family insertion sequence element accessory protein TnpB [Pseudomonas sp. GX19020]MCL4066596.1 IS66 family insertion sequence element accessory protein TnpB [Pseudomonas sp. GX19020]